MWTRTGNTLAAVEDSADRLASAAENGLADFNAIVRDVKDSIPVAAIQRDVHDALDEVREAARAHREAMAAVESLVWGVVVAACVWCAFDVARDIWGGLRHG